MCRRVVEFRLHCRCRRGSHLHEILGVARDLAALRQLALHDAKDVCSGKQPVLTRGGRSLWNGRQTGFRLELRGLLTDRVEIGGACDQGWAR